MAKLIDGKEIAATIRGELGEKVVALKTKYGKVPGLAVVLVGDRKDSATYVRMKKKACKEVGIAPFDFEKPGDVSQDELVTLIKDLNANPEVHGILVQLPLPDHIDEELVLSEISIEKDVDGFHPLNIGKLSMKGRDPLFVPCTPKGCITLIERMGFEISGKNAVVIGRSNIVGIPVAMLLLERNATVTICHSRTADVTEHLKKADIVVAAVGRAEMVKGEMLKPGCVVIDVGINSVDDATKKRGYRLVGDCHFDSCKEVAAAITPVPGGVGPMTIAMLLSNTVEGATKDFDKSI
jgi:5,10-methylene-tetrahydrofolate dehydrogenase/methenyl tetrahydrofolate cyclohydrolase